MTHSYHVGDEVRIPAIDRDGLIVNDLGDGSFRVEFIPVAATGVIDGIEPDDAGGIFSTDELEPLWGP